jgi:hypothetical protein
MWLLLLYAVLFCTPAFGSTAPDDPTSGEPPVVRPADAGSVLERQPPFGSINWGGIVKQSMLFNGIQHGFRLLTEPGTLDGFRGGYFTGYVRSVTNLHGWGDGDPFYVNYVGHPMEGAVAGYIWLQNDPAYRYEQFGRGSRYWKSRLRAMGFAFAYSTQFEIGPISEASIGQIQSRPPQTGFVDHIVTPVVGVGGWMVAEDALDRYVIRWIERKTTNPYARMMARGWLNPTRSFANLMRGEVPWYRDTRGGIFAKNPFATERAPLPEYRAYPPLAGDNAPFELTTSAQATQFVNGGACIGAGGTALFRFSPQWQGIVDVGGCKLLSPAGHSGDALFYSAGPRWTAPNERWRPHFQFTVGGQKITRDDREEANAFAVAAGGGLDVRINNTVALRLANLEIRRAWTPRPDFEDYRTSVRFSTGVVLQMGAW